MREEHNILYFWEANSKASKDVNYEKHNEILVVSQDNFSLEISIKPWVILVSSSTNNQSGILPLIIFARPARRPITKIGA